MERQGRGRRHGLARDSQLTRGFLRKMDESLRLSLRVRPRSRLRPRAAQGMAIKMRISKKTRAAV